ncbi:MAG: hypothetical protein LBT44_06760 [Clostridiales bacterium]|nr:hypothetical protein [Clostridiales bacterium]
MSSKLSPAKKYDEAANVYDKIHLAVGVQFTVAVLGVSGIPQEAATRLREKAADEKRKKQGYDRATALCKEGKHYDAAAAFKELGDFSNAQYMHKDCLRHAEQQEAAKIAKEKKH